MRILVVNSDLAANRGDRAIAFGLLTLVRERWPEASVTLVSEQAERDADWYGCEVLDQGIHSLNPLDLLRLMRAARRADLVLWGGGELLKDYTNRLGVWYWATKMLAVRLANREVYGTFQGIGPTKAASSRRLIAATVKRTRLFLTRDDESRDKLVAWGVPADRVVASVDCAVAPEVERAASRSESEPFAIVAPRSWFHYRTGGWLPHRWRRSDGPSADALALRDRTVEIVDLLVDEVGSVALLPMHMVEDPALARDIAERVARPERVRVLDADDAGPEQVEILASQAELVVAQRLHAGIIGAAAGAPVVTYFYVDKGRIFAEQMGAQDATRPIEKLLEADALADFSAMVAKIRGNHERTARARDTVADMRARLRADFARIGRP